MAIDEDSSRRDSLSPYLGERQSQQSPEDLTPFEHVPDAQLTPEFHNQPLQDPTRQIRLCRISPSDSALPLRVELETHTLESVVGGFWALSYPWGYSASPKSIILNDLVLNGSEDNLTLNLWTFLLRLRAVKPGQLFWIDALCIDQRNKSEKAAQVALMRSVFEGAEVVVVALDEECRDLHRAVTDHRIVKKSIEQLAGGRHLYDLSCCSNRKAFDPEVVRVTHRFLHSAWFTRVWTVQEIVLAKRSYILLADDLLLWDTFEMASRKWNEHMKSSCCASLVEDLDANLVEALHQTYSHISGINHVRNTLSNQPNILDAILAFPHLRAKLAVDRFNGFRGLHRATSTLPPPHYDRPIADALEIITMWLLETCDGLIALTLGPADESANLPHWVADLSLRPGFDANYWRAQIELYMIHDCQFRLGVDFVHEASGKLRMNSVELDVVSEAAPDIFVEGMDMESHIELLKKLYAFASGRQLAEIDCNSFDDVFSNLMLAGYIKKEHSNCGLRKAGGPDYARWRQTIAHLELSPSAESVFGVPISSHLNAVMQRRLFRTSKGFLGLGPPSVQAGDSLWLFSGGRAPFATRRVPVDETAEPQHQLLGYCYHQGLTNKQLDVTELVKRPTTCVLT